MALATTPCWRGPRTKLRADEGAPTSDRSGLRGFVRHRTSSFPETRLGDADGPLHLVENHRPTVRLLHVPPTCGAHSLGECFVVEEQIERCFELGESPVRDRSARSARLTFEDLGPTLDQCGTALQPGFAEDDREALEVRRLEQRDAAGER